MRKLLYVTYCALEQLGACAGRVANGNRREIVRNVKLRVDVQNATVNFE